MDNGKTGALIKKLRKEKGMTQKELADQLHITDRAVSKWERGLCAPDLSLLEPLAAALGVTVVELISGEQAAEEDTAVKELIDYSQRQITQKTRAFAKKIMAAAAALCLLLAMLIPTANGLVGGDGFAWRCIPAYLCAQRAARAIQTGDRGSHWGLHWQFGGDERGPGGAAGPGGYHLEGGSEFLANPAGRYVSTAGGGAGGPA